jgi:hypothetical protein
MFDKEGGSTPFAKTFVIRAQKETQDEQHGRVWNAPFLVDLFENAAGEQRHEDEKNDGGTVETL